jgi:hypothetical protein
MSKIILLRRVGCPGESRAKRVAGRRAGAKLKQSTPVGNIGAPTAVNLKQIIHSKRSGMGVLDQRFQSWRRPMRELVLGALAMEGLTTFRFSHSKSSLDAWADMAGLHQRSILPCIM